MNRFWWIVAFGLSVWMCSSSIGIIWSKWNDCPVTLSFTEKDKTISSISFPTVTICPETKANTNQMNLISIFKDFTSTTKLNLSETE